MDKITTDRRAVAVNDDRANGNTPESPCFCLGAKSAWELAS